MKKLVIIFISIAVIAGIGIGIYQITKGKELAIEDILPAEAIFAVQLNDVENNFQELAAMPFWQGIRNINMDLLVENNILNAQQSMFINLVQKQLSDVLDSPLSKRLFGKEIVFAVYPLQKDMSLIVQGLQSLNPKLIEEFLSGLFIVTRVDSDVQFAEFVSRFFDQFGSNVSRGQLKYKDETIHVISVPAIGMKFGGVRLKDLLVIGIGENAARTSIDVFKGDEPSLAMDANYAQVQQKYLEPSAMNGFFNFELFFESLKEEGPNIVRLAQESNATSDIQAQWDNFLAQIIGIKAFGLSSQLNPLMRIDSHIIFDPKQLSAEYAPLYTCRSTENKTIHFVPKEVMGYQWSNCFQLDYYWDQITKELERSGASSVKITEMETQMGMSIENDILPTFGEEIGGYVQDVEVGGFFPIPKFLLFIQIKNQANAQRLLDKMKEQPMVMLQEENYKGTTVKYLSLPLGQSLQPGYCFLKDYLLVSTSLQLLKDSIDASTNASLALTANPSFKQVNLGLTKKNRSVQFLKVGQMIEKVKRIIGWSNQWIAAREMQAQAFKTGGEKPLEEVESSIATKKEELKGLKDHIILLEDEIWNMETKGVDINTKQAEYDDLKIQLDLKKDEIVAEEERKKELTTIVQEYEESAPDPELRQLILDDIVYPVLEGFKSIQTYGLRSTISNNDFETSLFLKVR